MTYKPVNPPPEPGASGYGQPPEMGKPADYLPHPDFGQRSEYGRSSDHGDGHQYPGAGQPSAGPARGAGGRNGVMGGLAALGFLLLKFGAFLLKGKFLIYMLFNIVLYAFFFGQRMGFAYGLAFAFGFVALIFVHEMGHLIAARMVGVKASAPFFIPFMGAAIFLQSNPRDARDEAIIGIGGPITGTLGALATFGLGMTVGPGTDLGQFFIVLASYGFLINLFNMIPISPLDGGRVLGAVSKWFNVVGLAILAIAVFSGYLGFSIVIILVLAVGGYGTYKRFTQPEKPGYYQVSAAAKAVIGVSYLTLLAILAYGVAGTEAYVSTVGGGR